MVNSADYPRSVQEILNRSFDATNNRLNTNIGSATQTFDDDILLRLGTDGDQVFLNRSTALAANTALTNVLVGTTAGSRQALAANSLIVSNVTSLGDIGVYVNDSGNSYEAFLADGSARTLWLNSGGTALRIHHGVVSTPNALLATTSAMIFDTGTLAASSAIFFKSTGTVSNVFLNLTGSVIDPASVGEIYRSSTSGGLAFHSFNGGTTTVGFAFTSYAGANAYDTTKTTSSIGETLFRYHKNNVTTGAHVNFGATDNLFYILIRQADLSQLTTLIIDASGSIYQLGVQAGTSVIAQIEHTDTVNAASHAGVNVKVANATADPSVTFTLPAAGTNWYVGVDNSASDVFMIGRGLVVGTTPVIQINSSDLIGYGTIDIEAWATATFLDVIQIGAINAIASGDTVGNGLQIVQNAYYDGAWKYRTTQVATVYTQSSGAHFFRSAASGTIDTAITWVTLFYLDGNGPNSVIIGGTGSGASATFNLVMSGGATTPVLGAATADLVHLAGVDFAVGDRRLYIQSELGSRIILGNNVLTLGLAGTGTGSLTMSGATSGTVTMTVAAAAGTWTMTLPTAVGTAGFQLTDAGGDGITSWSGAGSLLAYKNLLPESEWLRPQDALDRILHTRVPAFHYKPGMGTLDTVTRYDGPIADEAPWAMHYQGGILNPISTFGHTILAIQAQEDELTSIKRQMIALQERLAVLEGART